MNSIENLIINKSDSAIENIDNIEIVNGYVHISCKEFYSNINSLGKIKTINGDAYLRYSFISSLGDLEIVNGNLNLRDTLINDLGKLIYVKGNLFLPKRLENTIEIKYLKVEGKIKYWNDDKQWFRPTKEKTLEIEKIKEEYNNHHLYYKNGNYEKAWEIYKQYNQKVLNRGVNIIDIYFYEKLINKPLLEPIDIISSTGTTILNSHTIKNLEAYLSHLSNRVNSIYNEHGSYFNYFFGKSKVDFNKINSSFLISKKAELIFNEETFESYKSNFYSETEFNFRRNQLKQHFKIKYVSKDHFNCFVESALIERLKHIVREEEDNFRLSLGLPKIGEGWISETELYQKIKNHYQEYTVIHHGKPKWLGRQHFDIWIPELKIAIEYQGLQHDTAVEYFGGEISFEANKKRDEVKKQLCIKNKCLLIEVRPNYDFEEIINQIRVKLNNH
jgi:hypothetical protein